VRRHLSLLIVLAAGAAAFAWPPLGARQGRGLSARVPVGWRARSVETGLERVLQVEGGPLPPLRIEAHFGSPLDPLRYAGALEGRRAGLTAVRLGGVSAFETRTQEAGHAEKFASGGLQEGRRGRVYYLFRDGGSFLVASYAEPRGAWQRWRAERVYRRVLSSLRLVD
jgi:hypothetical protein